MIIKLLTAHHLEFLSLKEAAEARPSLHLSKCQIVGNLMSRLNEKKGTRYSSKRVLTVYGRKTSNSAL